MRSVVRIYPGPPAKISDFEISDFEISNTSSSSIAVELGELGAGWSSPVARWAHNPKVAGSNPAPATILDLNLRSQSLVGGVAQLAEHRVCNAGVRGSNPLASTRTFVIAD